MSLLHIGGSSGTSVVSAEGVDFDGTYDYLSRSTDLVGNVDSKTFTFSAWVYSPLPVGGCTVYSTEAGTFAVNINSAGALVILATDGNTTNRLVYQATGVIPQNTFIHILMSMDMSSSLKRHVYINGILMPDSFITYVDTPLDFTRGSHNIGADKNTGSKMKGRLSNVFLDYTYRDLSIEANRRLFITADGKPTPTATLKALNPILYLPMKDAATAHINLGTGGNFTANGTFATSNRGANQDNCVASKFDGTADYLSRTFSTTATSITISFTCTLTNVTSHIISSSSSSAQKISIKHLGNGDIYCVFNNLAGALVLNKYTETEYFKIGRLYNFSISFDTAIGLSSFKFLANGVDETARFTGGGQFLQNGIVPITTFMVAKDTQSGTYFNSNLGELYFDTKYIDLATSNPFWDSAENKPVPVRKVIADTGVTPLIAMPLDASNPGKNYGNGGDFTANSAPYVGARGASEYIARSAKINTTSDWLQKTVSGLSSSKTITLVFNYKTVESSGVIIDFGVGSNYKIRVNESVGYINLFANSSSSAILNIKIQTSTAIADGEWNTLLLSVDLSSSANRACYLNNTSIPVSNYLTYTNDLIDLASVDNIYMFKGSNTNPDPEQSLSSVYFTTDYIDFSQEVNRLKFVDGLGYPLDLAKQIESGAIPTPLIYLPFDDTTNLGKNLGTGGNFTVNGTVTAGADFSL